MQAKFHSNQMKNNHFGMFWRCENVILGKMAICKIPCSKWTHTTAQDHMFHPLHVLWLSVFSFSFQSFSIRLCIFSFRHVSCIQFGLPLSAHYLSLQNQSVSLKQIFVLDMWPRLLNEHIHLYFVYTWLEFHYMPNVDIVRNFVTTSELNWCFNLCYSETPLP